MTRRPAAPGGAPPSPGTGASSSSSTTRTSSAPRTTAAVACYRNGAAALTPPAELVHIPYGGTTLAAYLRVPHRGTAETTPPVVIMVPGLDSTKEELQATAEYFLARGLATIAIDGPGQGESEYELPIEPAYEKVATAVIDYLTTRGDVNSDDIGLFGVSLGGYYAARCAAYEHGSGPPSRWPVPTVRPGLGELPAADQGDLPGPLPRRYRGGGAGQGRRAHARGRARPITRPLLVVGGGRDSDRARLSRGAPRERGARRGAAALPRWQPRRDQPRLSSPGPGWPTGWRPAWPEPALAGWPGMQRRTR